VYDNCVQGVVERVFRVLFVWAREWFHVEQLLEGDVVPNLDAASSLRDPEPLQMELQHSRCAVESESLGCACFRCTFGTFNFFVAFENISVCKRAKCLGNGGGPVHLTQVISLEKCCT